MKKEFSGEETVYYDGVKNKASMKGTSVEIRAGMSMQAIKNVYWYAAASYESGSDIRSRGLDAGLRFVFGGSKKLKYPSDKEVWDKKAIKANAEKSFDVLEKESSSAEPETKHE